MNDQELREKVHNMRQFYIKCTYVGIAVFAAFLLWAITGGGYFWPAWIIVGGGLGLAFQAITSGLFPALNEYFPFFKKDWEEDQIKQLKKPQQHQPTMAMHAAPKAAAKKKAAAKSAAPKAKKKAPVKMKAAPVAKAVVKKAKKAPAKKAKAAKKKV